MSAPLPGGALVKAMLRVSSPGTSSVSPGPVTFRFNPRELSVSKSSSWAGNASPNSAGDALPTFVTSDPKLFSIDLFFDGWETPSTVVRDDIETLLSWVGVAGHNSTQNVEPPTLQFAWGGLVFDCYLTQLNARYTMFRPDGSPLRAQVNVSLMEKVPRTQATNPSSGGVPGRASHVLREGDTLQSVAHQHYGRPTLWRAIAEANGIDDPLRVPAGTVLLIPPATAARRSP